MAENEIIPKDPTFGFNLTVAECEETGVLDAPEVKELMNEASIEKYWQGDKKYYLANLISCLTGLRKAEVVCLKEENIKENYIEVLHSINPYDGIKDPKNGKKRKVPIPRKLYEILKDIFPENKGFIFSVDGNTPIYKDKPKYALYNALAAMGIDEKQRRERNIHFHSWRHWLNSLLVKKNINSSKIKQVVGHTEKGDMTDHYTHFNITDFEDVVRIQEELLESFKGEQSA